MPLSNSATSVSSGCWSKPPSLRPESATNWRWSRERELSEVIRIRATLAVERRSRHFVPAEEFRATAAA